MTSVVNITTLVIVIIILIFVLVIIYYLFREGRRINGIIKKFNIKKYLQGNPETGDIGVKYEYGKTSNHSAVVMI